VILSANIGNSVTEGIPHAYAYLIPFPSCKIRLKSLGIPVEKSPPFRHDPPINQIGGRKDDGIHGKKHHSIIEEARKH
jgi:hypothetical protein